MEGAEISCESDWRVLVEEDFADLLARSRLADPAWSPTAGNPLPNPEVHPVERQFAERLLRGEAPEHSPLVAYPLLRYWRERLQAQKLLYGAERAVLVVHLKLASWDGTRWHLRTLLLGFPSVIVVPGIRLALAGRRAAYVAYALGVGERPEPLFSEEAPALRLAVLVYLVQALAYYQDPVGFSFCEDPHCLLYNPHYAEELRDIVLSEAPPACPAHREVASWIRKEVWQKWGEAQREYERAGG